MLTFVAYINFDRCQTVFLRLQLYFFSKIVQRGRNAHHSCKVDKCTVNYGRSTNLLEPVRMALCGPLIALLRKPQQRFYAIKYARVAKRSTAHSFKHRNKHSRQKAAIYISSWISPASQMHAICSNTNLILCIQDNMMYKKKVF